MSSALCLLPLTVSNPSIFPTTNTKLPCKTRRGTCEELTASSSHKSSLPKSSAEGSEECKAPMAHVQVQQIPASRNARRALPPLESLRSSQGSPATQRRTLEAKQPEERKTFPSPRIAVKVSEGKRRRGGKPRCSACFGRVGDVYGRDFKYL